VGHLSSLAAKRYEDLLGLEGRSVPKAVSSWNKSKIPGSWSKLRGT
jgi:hypothetical protein